MKTYQFWLQPTTAQLRCIKSQLEIHRQLYNKCLEQKIRTYESAFDLMKSIVPQFKGQSNYSSLQQTARRLEKSFKAFFKKHNGFPRFKKRFRTIQFAKLGDGCQLKNDGIYIQHVGVIKTKFHRKFPAVKTISITLKDNKLFVNLHCEEFAGKLPKRDNVVGIDFGVRKTITLSDGLSVESPKLIKSKLRQIRSCKRRKNYKALNHIHEKIRNKRKDFNHKLSRKIVDSYDIICLEDLQVNSLKSEKGVHNSTKRKNINRRLFDIGIKQLSEFIVYKAESAGKLVVKVNPAYTTQTCSSCGIVQVKKVSQRKHICCCGLVLDRDVNAAINIKTLGLQSLASA